MKINFIRAFTAIQDYASSEELSSNELVLLLALFRAMNDRYWPDGMVGITNNQLLVYTTFAGSKRDETLRQARARLVERGVILYTPGVAYKSRPEYGINWQALGITPEDTLQDDPQDTPQDDPKKGGISGGYINNKTKTKTETETKTAVYPMLPTENEHTQLSSQQSTPRAREDSAWRYSPRARGAVAQRLMDEIMPMLVGNWAPPDTYDVFFQALTGGIAPNEIRSLAKRFQVQQYFVTALRMEAVRARGIECVPESWFYDKTPQELEAEVQDIIATLRDPLMRRLNDLPPLAISFVQDGEELMTHGYHTG